MYRIMLVDDEGIMIDSMRYMIERNFKGVCDVESAKTGRGAIELAESFHPDIVFMDIQMPGINGIEAMEDMRANNQSTVFIVLSAYDKFNYARQAIDLGVLEYLTKPIRSEKIVEVLKKAMSEIDKKRKKKSDELAIREKLRTVVPVIEHSFIYTVLFQDARESAVENYKKLLGVEDSFGYMLVLECGDETDHGKLTNPVGASVALQKSYKELRESVKEFWTVIMGEPMANRVAMVITCQEDKMEYETRIRIIEDARVLLRKLTKQLSMSYQLGIGSVKPIEELSQSYQEALEALRNSVGKVTHVEDIPTVCTYEDNYPIQLETALFASVEKGNIRAVKEYGSQFFDWMEETASEEIDSIRLKVIEFVLWAEHFAFESGSMKTYHFCDRKSYLKELLQCAGLKELKIWFMDKMEMATKNIEKKKENQANGVVE
ncbi:MAG: response regulator, partial [Lachnospiraceae bacterium]